ncbi:ArsA family ATPase [Natronobacterium gregoryi]|uniref:Arsenic-transporting ATPase n=2 Tax=Natronobacterium gregoryi TaxID=44930 RepID=L0AHF1_NATGS|nr:TRC40/GET3/ArsA family transport-energizing ATPase [Natronobacterium gregoryi]AFZ73221.1 arsenite-activated ATPase ArsA [Natronobacterium gregoryi SP2]ELY71321.1 arsenite-activated ATPase ArsA [Natronobacterium gregoryi SP2]PLK21628.1 arsenic-transporting ATPase [Natronobacterium gregoryi SP2]SFI58101.1 arsenite efflux ATP-binding protein ArsA [Natronobacterium gregoryi]
MSGIDVEPVDGEAESADDDTTIEVTPTDSVDDTDERRTVDVDPAGEPIEGPDYVLYGGKGGVGKTTMAAATALDSARSGVRTLVVSTDPAHSLSDTFETDVPSDPGRLREDIPLYGAEIDPEAAMERGQAAFLGDGGPGGGAGPLGGLGDMFGDDSPMDALFGGSMPGADEAAAMQLLLEYLDDDRFERVVVDTAPTGHTLRLLELPEIMDTMVGRILQFRQRIGGMFENMKGMFGGQEPPEDPGDLEDLQVLRERIERLRAALRDPARTDFRIVLVPEEMSVFESKRLREQLEEFSIPVGTVVVNRVMEPLSDVTDAVEGDAAFLQPNLDDCEFCQQRWDVQQSALAEAQELFRGTDVKRVPLFADEVRGDRMLAVVAACLR